jgi:hypothetical protein
MLPERQNFYKNKKPLKYQFSIEITQRILNIDIQNVKLDVICRIHL